MNRRRSIALVPAAALTLARSPVGAQSRSAITVATIAIEPLAGVFFARDMGFFEQNGLDVTVQAMNNGPAITAAVIGGAANVGGSNLISLAVAYAKGVPVTLVAPAALYQRGTPVVEILVRKDSAIRTAADLAGKTVAATPLNGISQWSTDSWVDQNGGDSSKVRWLEVPSPAMGAALQQGRIDASVEPEPLLTHDLPNARVLADPYPAVANRFLTSAYFATSAWAQAHPDEIGRFATALRLAGAWANKNPAASGDLLAKITQLDRDTIARMNRVTFAERLAAPEIQPNIDLAKKYDAIDRAFPATAMIFPARR